MERFRIILPLPAKVLSPNWTAGSMGSRFAKAAATKRYRALVKAVVEESQVDSIPWKYVQVDSVFYHKTSRVRDEDNAMGSLKAAYDGIVDAGVVFDDDSLNMKKSIPVFKKDRETPRVELTLIRGEKPCVE